MPFFPCPWEGGTRAGGGPKPPSNLVREFRLGFLALQLGWPCMYTSPSCQAVGVLAPQRAVVSSQPARAGVGLEGARNLYILPGESYILCFLEVLGLDVPQVGS